MDIFWPADLPQAPQVSNYKHATANNTVSFKAELADGRVDMLDYTLFIEA